MNVAAAAELFIAHYHNSGTRKANRYAVDLLVRTVGPHVNVRDLTSVDLLRYAQAVESMPFTAATKRKYQKTIKTFCNWMVKMEWIEKSPARMVVPHRINTMIDRNKAIPEHDVKLVLDWARHQRSKRTWALLAVLADTGIRIGGAAKLRLTDLDFEAETITVTEKGDKTRTVPLYTESLHALRVWLIQRHGHASEYVFVDRGATISPDALGQVVARACRAAGCTKAWGPHSFRHRVGKRSAKARINPTFAAAAMGQDVMTYLQNYVGADLESIRDALRELALPSSRGAPAMLPDPPKAPERKPVEHPEFGKRSS